VLVTIKSGPPKQVRRIDVWCTSCDRKITLEEVASDYHLEHIFEPMEWAAIQAVSMYVRGATFLRPN
jgi:hypothetical protein